MIRRIPQTPFIAVEKSIFAGNPLIASVLRENVCVQTRRATIALWPHWPVLLREVRSFGRVLSICRNPHAVLGRIGAYPEVWSAACGHCACGADGATEYYFSCWDRAFVSIEEQPGGWLYAVEFQDAWGDTLHKICLTAGSEFEAFREWVELNQRVEPDSAAPLSFRNGSCAPAAEPVPGEDGILLRPAVICAVLRRLIDERMVVQAVTGNDGFVQGANLRPVSLRETGQWIFASDGDCGLHLRVGRLAEVCLQRVSWREGGGSWVIKAFEPEGRLACVFAPPRDGDVSGWDDFLLEATASFHIKTIEEP